MSQDLQSVLAAAYQLPLDQQRRLAEAILGNIRRVAAARSTQPGAPMPQSARDEEITRRLNELYEQEESALDAVLMQMQVQMSEQEDWSWNAANSGGPRFRPILQRRALAFES